MGGPERAPQSPHSLRAPRGPAALLGFARGKTGGGRDASSQQTAGRLLQRWAALGPGAEALEGGGGAQDQSVLETPADDLEADGEAARREARGHGDGRLAAPVEGIAERPAEVGH